MDSFTFVIFGFTSNLAKLKIIPALYDLEEKKLLSPETKIVGIGRKDLEISKYIREVLSEENRHHLHDIKEDVTEKLISRVLYYSDDFEKKDGPLYLNLKKISGNILYYLATYPNLYTKIFQSLKDNSLNDQGNGWVRMMIEKPIGNDLNTAKSLGGLLSKYFSEDQIFRVDHYLGKERIRNLYEAKIEKTNIDRVEVFISENFGIGKRGVYYDATGALIDMGQNHLLQMIAAVFSKSPKPDDRADVLEKLVPESKDILFGQYEGYLKEENVSPVSITDTFFLLKTEMKDGFWKSVPIYISSGKMLSKNEAGIEIFYKDGKRYRYLITPTEVQEQFDPYERLILDAIKGDQTFFNSKREIEASWKFIDQLSIKLDNPFIYSPGSNLTDGMPSKFTSKS